MNDAERKFTRVTNDTPATRKIETIIGCKWSLTVFQLIKNNINRPGEMVRVTDGLTTKVLNDCLRKNCEFGVLRKIIYPESPPRVEYQLTAYGEKVSAIFDQILSLDSESSP